MGTSEPMTVTRFDLVNPHDAYTIDAADIALAGVAAAFIGGMYAASLGNQTTPLTALGPSPWWREHAGMDVEPFAEHVLATRRGELVAALRSVAIDANEYDALVAAGSLIDPAVWHDKRRTSMADLRARALALASFFDRETV